MILTLISVFILFSWLARRLGAFKISRYLAAAAALIFFAVGSGYWPELMIARLQRTPRALDPSWKERNVIVVLGAGTALWPDAQTVTTVSFGTPRTLEAARLYFLCKKQKRECRVLPSGGDPSHSGTSEAEVMARELVEIGVDKADIAIESKSRNTFQNAQFSSLILRDLKPDNVFLVTTGIHMPRSLIFFEHFYPEVTPAPADFLRASLSVLPVSVNFLLMDLALHELLGTLRYFVYNALALNPPKLR